MKPSTIYDRWTLVILLASGAWMIWAASHYTVFDDEAFSCQRYVMPMGEMVRGLWNGVEPDPPLYYVLENLSVRVFGVGPLGLRFLSIILFLAGLLFMRAVATEAWDRATGIATMVLCAIHPAHLFLGFAARWYSTMFLAVAVLLCVSRRLVETDGSTERKLTILWALSAAAVLYTNYFGIVVVGFIWLAASWRSWDKRRCFAAGLLAALLFAPWLPPFWRQMTAFPRFSGSAGSMFATAARTTMALLAGDLASPRAWWVWGPMAVFLLLLAAIFIRNRRRMALITFVVAGCFIAGVVSRTMIDKYIMTFSGVFCLWLARLLVKADHEPSAPRERLRFSAIAALSIAWLGCGYNLITERNWSSLRWLDPFEAAVADAKRTGVPSENWVVTHPAGRYYAARAFTHSRTDWMRLVMHEYRSKRDDYLRTPARLYLETSRGAVPAVITLEGAGFSESSELDKFRRLLESDYRLEQEHRYFEDPDAAWKDRLDPEYHHPRWRIIVRHWRLKSEPRPSGSAAQR